MPPGQFTLFKPCFGRLSALHGQKGKEEIRLACLTDMRAARSRAAAPAQRTARMKSAVFLLACPSLRTMGRCTPTQMEKLAWVSVGFSVLSDCVQIVHKLVEGSIKCLFSPFVCLSKRLVKCVEWSGFEMLFTPKQRGSAAYPAPEVIPLTQKRPAYWPDFRYHTPKLSPQTDFV